MDDETIIAKINELAHEEHRLYERDARGEGSTGDRERLQTLQETLDQCWDLLRQRQARRAAGLDPEDAQMRDVKTVEGYKQ